MYTFYSYNFNVKSYVSGVKEYDGTFIFATGHVNYDMYGLYYTCSIERLPNNILQQFRLGEHVMRYKPRLQNSKWSDMYIESIFMRYWHGPGGIIGVTLNPSALKRWSLCLHKCIHII